MALRMCSSLTARANVRAVRPITAQVRNMSGCCHWFEPTAEGDDIWQVESNRIKYGAGALREIGSDATVLGMKRVAIFTDKGVSQLEGLHTITTALDKEGIDYAVYDEVLVEPTDVSFKESTKFAVDGRFDSFISFGGGSVMDTCKAANLYATFPTDDFLDYVNPPIGGGKVVPGPLSPHIACPTTSGTGSESTGLAIFDLLSMHAKTGIASRRIKPDLGIIDPTTTFSLPSIISACSGFDVLSHAVESFTARPFTRRKKDAHPTLRPMSQGSNPFSDIGCREAIRLCGKYLARAARDANDVEAREAMMFASTLAGIAFGNVGCHMPHGLSYSVSGLVKDFQAPHYPTHKPQVPHGMSVILNAPSVFRFTADACMDRHLEAATLLGADTKGASPEDGVAGELLAGRMIEMMKEVEFPNGLEAVGYTASDLDDLVSGAMPQKRLLENAPKPVAAEDVKGIYKGALRYW